MYLFIYFTRWLITKCENVIALKIKNQCFSLKKNCKSKKQLFDKKLHVVGVEINYKLSV